MEANFLEKFLLAQKWAKRPKWLNLSICLLLQNVFQDWLISFFLYFTWSWSTISTQIWHCQIFLENSGLPKNRSKRSKMAQLIHLSVNTAFFSGLGHQFFSIFCMKLRTISTQSWWRQGLMQNYKAVSNINKKGAFYKKTHLKFYHPLFKSF